MSREATRDALLEALCGCGWDAPVELDLSKAQSLAEPERVQGDVFLAAALGEVQALERLLDADPLALTRPGGPRGWPPLLYAAASFAHRLPERRAEPAATLRLLLARGADPDTAYFVPEHDNGFSALYLSIAITGDRARVDALLAAGAHPSDGNSSYHAVETFDLDLLQALGRAGLDREDVSYTIKHAIDLGWGEAVRFFLDQGADPNATHPLHEETTLHWAVLRGASPAVLEALLDAGADPMARTRPGHVASFGLVAATPLDYALRLGEQALAERLQARGAVPGPPSPEEAFLRAVARGDAEAARAGLAALPGGLDALDEAGRGMLAHWAQHGALAAVRLAPALGFPLDATAWLGLTALHWAALRGDLALTRALLDAGAPQSDLGGYFGTPANVARECQWYGGDYAGVLALLAEAG